MFTRLWTSSLNSVHFWFEWRCFLFLASVVGLSFLTRNVHAAFLMFTELLCGFFLVAKSSHLKCVHFGLVATKCPADTWNKIPDQWWDYIQASLKIAHHSFQNVLPSITGNKITGWCGTMSINWAHIFGLWSGSRSGSTLSVEAWLTWLPNYLTQGILLFWMSDTCVLNYLSLISNTCFFCFFHWEVLNSF